MEYSNRLRLQHLYEARIRSALKLHSLTGIPLMTIRDNLKRFEEGRGAERAPGSGQPRILKPNDRRRVAQLAAHHRSWPSVRIRDEAVKRGTRKVTDRTIRGTLKRQGYIKLIPRKIPMLTRAMKANRVKWCYAHLNDNWDTTIFSDETIFQFYRTSAKQWTKHGKPRKPAPPHGPQLLIWGGISSRGKTSLAFVDGTVDTRKYCEILEQHLLDYATKFPDGWRFQQDNAPSHRAKITQEWLQEHNIDVLEWPANSPDLNPIENCWWLIKNAVEGQDPQTPEKWKETIVKTWENQGSHFVHNMRNRLQKCIDAKGDVIHY
jgi:transposase